MQKSLISSKSGLQAAAEGGRIAEGARAKPASATERLVERLAKARTANEITNVIGLRPIKGRSGPKIAY